MRFSSLYRKARRKERDGDASQSDTKIYLEESVLELLKFTPADLRSMVDLPAGLDYNEWLASYSKYRTRLCRPPGIVITNWIPIAICSYTNI